MSEPTPLLAVGIEEGQLSGGAQGLNRFLRVGDLRDLNRYAVLAAEGYGSLGKALVGQTLTNDLLYRVHVVGQVVGVVAVRDFGLVYDTGAARPDPGPDGYRCRYRVRSG